MKRIASLVFLRALPIVLGMVLISLVIIKVLYGTGNTYPDIDPARNIAGERHLEKLIELDYPPGNIAVGQN